MRKNYESLASLFPESLPQFLHILPKFPSQDNVLVNFTIYQILKATTSLWQFPGYIALVLLQPHGRELGQRVWN